MVSVETLFGSPEHLFLIAGPCVLEDDALNLEIAERLATIGQTLGLPILFKASFDKANRSSIASPRGPGIEPGLRQLQRIHDQTGLPLLTDVHEPKQCTAAAEVVDVLQIPAFLCRQTDLLVAAGSTGRAVNVKKGQWMSTEGMGAAVTKCAQAGANGVAVTERGTFFGYGDLVVDMRNFANLRETTPGPVIFDGTHSVQRPGGAGAVTGGDPHHIPSLVSAAIAAGADALFLEVHPHPETAPSDSTNMLQIDRLEPLLKRVLDIRSAIGRAHG